MIIPPLARPLVLEQLHEGHPGISQLKALSRSYVWWPGLDSDVEQTVEEYSSCQQQQKSPPWAPLHPWEWPDRPWSRLHLDFAGPFMKRMFW